MINASPASRLQTKYNQHHEKLDVLATHSGGGEKKRAAEQTRFTLPEEEIYMVRTGEAVMTANQRHQAEALSGHYPAET